MTSVAYIDHAQLAELIKTKEAGKDYQIVDVRDDDFAGGNIVGAMHEPSESATNESIRQLSQKLESVPKVIFHCALSQSRGPRAARAFAKAIDANDPSGTAASATPEQGRTFSPNPFEPGLYASGESDEPRSGGAGGSKKQEVLILRNGWTNWSSLYADDPALVENFEKSRWQSFQHDTRWGGSGH